MQAQLCAVAGLTVSPSVRHFHAVTNSLIARRAISNFCSTISTFRRQMSFAACRGGFI